jgi:hypothetical protein
MIGRQNALRALTDLGRYCDGSITGRAFYKVRFIRCGL